MNIQTQYAYLYGYESLTDKPATLYYLPNSRCRKWRKGFYVRSFSQVAYDSAMKLCVANEWYSFKFE